LVEVGDVEGEVVVRRRRDVALEEVELAGPEPQPLDRRLGKVGARQPLGAEQLLVPADRPLEVVADDRHVVDADAVHGSTPYTLSASDERVGLRDPPGAGRRALGRGQARDAGVVGPADDDAAAGRRGARAAAGDGVEAGARPARLRRPRPAPRPARAVRGVARLRLDRGEPDPRRTPRPREGAPRAGRAAGGGSARGGGRATSGSSCPRSSATSSCGAATRPASTWPSRTTPSSTTSSPR